MNKKEPPVYRGWYLYKNISGGDYLLQRPLTNGRHIIKAGAEFEGDDYYMNLPGIKLVSARNNPYAQAEPEAPAPTAAATAERVSTPGGECLWYVDIGNFPINDVELEIRGPEGQALRTVRLDAINPVDLTRKELLEYAAFKGVKVYPNMSRTAIVEKIRSVGKEG